MEQCGAHRPWRRHTRPPRGPTGGRAGRRQSERAGAHASIGVCGVVPRGPAGANSGALGSSRGSSGGSHRGTVHCKASGDIASVTRICL